jgi:hypothetical protein
MSGKNLVTAIEHRHAVRRAPREMYKPKYGVDLLDLLSRKLGAN